MIRFQVAGSPIPQPRPKVRVMWPSAAALLKAGIARGILEWIKKKTFPQVYYPSKEIRPWREAVERAARPHRPAHPLEGPIALALLFRLKRPQSHLGTGRNEGTLRPSAPNALHTSLPDLDNLAKAVLDALVDAKLIADDRQVFELRAVKRWADPNQDTGVVVALTAHASLDHAAEEAEAPTPGLV